MCVCVCTHWKKRANSVGSQNRRSDTVHSPQWNIHRPIPRPTHTHARTHAHRRAPTKKTRTGECASKYGPKNRGSKTEGAREARRGDGGGQSERSHARTCTLTLFLCLSVCMCVSLSFSLSLSSPPVRAISPLAEPTFSSYAPSLRVNSYRQNKEGKPENKILCVWSACVRVVREGVREMRDVCGINSKVWACMRACVCV